MSVFRRVALGFPLEWGHRRPYEFSAIARPGAAPYFIEWDPGGGIYGEDFTAAPRDDRGVLLSGRGRQYHAIRIAQFALHRHRIWASDGDAGARDDFLAQATYLRDAQECGPIEGVYRFAFPWPKYGARPGWVSAMAQGEAISVLLRAERESPAKGYGDAAVRAALPFARGINDGGVTWRSGKDAFFEEIAEKSAPHVLNGCVFALFGLWELDRVVPEQWRRDLMEICADTIERWIPRFDTGWWTLYSLMLSAAQRPHLSTLKYHAFHIAQFRVLSKMFDRSSFESAAQRWTQYAENAECRTRLLADTWRSLPERLLKRDTVAGGAHT